MKLRLRSAVRAACRREPAPVAAALLGSLAISVYSARAQGQSGSVVGLRLTNGDDCVAATNIDVIADGGETTEAIGVYGGRGQDTIGNVGTIAVGSEATGTTDPVTATATGITVDEENGTGRPRGAGSANQQAGWSPAECHDPGAASSGSGPLPHNAITNSGTMTVNASATATDATAPLAVESHAVGIEGSDRGDLIVNEGPLTVTATTTVTIADFADPATSPDSQGPGMSDGHGQSGNGGHGGNSPPEHAKGPERSNEHSSHNRDDDEHQSPPEHANGPDNSSENSSHNRNSSGSGAGQLTVSLARTVGIEAGDGDDTVVNAHLLTATSNATLSVGQVDLGIFSSTPFTATEARAESTGIDTAGGNDLVRNSGTIDVDATSSTQAGSLTISAVSLPGGVWNGGSAANSTGVGIAAGDGDDRVGNIDDGTLTGQILVDATATARAQSADVSAFAVTEMITSANATATTIGVDAGSGADLVRNAGIVGTASTATARSMGLSVNGVGATAVQDALFERGTKAVARSIGIDGGDGDDRLFNTNLIDAGTESWMFSGQANVTYLGVSIVNAAGIADSTSFGIDGGLGTDVLGNSGDLTARAFGRASSLDLALNWGGFAMSPSSSGGPLTEQFPGFGPFADSRTLANATTAGLIGGEGDDRVVNDTGATLISNAASETIVVGLVATTNSVATTGINRLLANTYVDSATGATATATGISGDLPAISIGPSAIPPAAPAVPPYEGNDTLINRGTIDVDASSIASVAETNFAMRGETVPFFGPIFGNALGKGGAWSAAQAIGIDGAGGDDRLQNLGIVDVFADGRLPSLGISARVTNGPSVGLGSNVDVDARGFNGGDGADFAVNRGTITAIGDATATSVGIGVSTSGLASGVNSTLTLDSLATGIDMGAGEDVIVSGTDDPDDASAITANARSIGTAYDFLWNNATPNRQGKAPTVLYTAVASDVTSIARATGIDAAGLPTTTTDELPVYEDEIGALFPVSLGVNYRTTQFSGDETDRVLNYSVIDADAVARAIALAGTRTGAGVTEAKAPTVAAAEAAAINTGGGDDEIRNFGWLQSDAIASSDSGSSSYTTNAGLPLPALAADGTRSTASSIGIDADGRFAARMTEVDIQRGLVNLPDALERATGDDLIVNAGQIDAFSRASTLAGDAMIVGKFLAVSRNDNETEAMTTAIDAGGGSDIVRNSGALTATAEAQSVTLGAAVTLGAGAAAAWSRGTSSDARAVGIDGDGDSAGRDNAALLFLDTQVETGIIPVPGPDPEPNPLPPPNPGDPVFAGCIPVLAGQPTLGLPPDFGCLPDEAEFRYVDEAHANLQVIQSELGNDGEDLLVNTGSITTEARAFNIEGQVSVQLSEGVRVSAAVTDARSQSDATAILGGGGDDVIRNFGTLDSTAFTTAGSAAVSLSFQGVAAALNKIVDGGTSGTARASGIDAGGLAARGRAVRATSDFTLDPFYVASDVVTTEFETRAVDDDVIRNEGNITIAATTIAPSVGVAVSGRGVSGAITTATADTDAAAIRAGAGDDLIRNIGVLDTTAWANADAVNVTVAPVGVAFAANALFDGGVVGEARAVGIEADGLESIERSRTLDQDSFNLEVSTVETHTYASGNDIIINEGLAGTTQGEIDVTSNAVVPSIAVAYTGSGVGGAVTTATSNATAAAIDAGGGDDLIRNSARLGATSLGNADVVNVSVTPAGVALAADAIWDGGASSTSIARGIDADGGVATSVETRSLTRGESCNPGCNPDAPPPGFTVERSLTETFHIDDDTVVNSASIDATARAYTPSIGVSVTATAGAAIAVTSAEANADATAIEVGAGADFVDNSGDLTSTAFANADSVSVGYSTAVGAVAGNNVWEGGTTANALASGISAGGLVSRTVGVTIRSAGDDKLSFEDVVEYDDSEDVVINTGIIKSNANAISPAVSVAITPAGVAAALSTATANARAEGISTGGGIDRIRNEGAITADADATAVAINVAGAASGVGLAGDAAWNGGTHANSTAVAIDAGGADDLIRNSARLETFANSIAPSISVPVAIYGVGLGESTSTSKAFGFGIDAGDGNDRIINTGDIETFVRADAESIGVAVNVFGVSGTGSAAWDGGVRAYSNTAGISAGTGDDTVSNTNFIHSTGRSLSVSGQIGFTLGGVTAAVSTSSAGTDVDGIDLGAGNDTVVNEGDITGEGFATGVAVGGTLGVFGGAGSSDAFWDNGTDATVSVDGIDGGVGDDGIRNEAIITAESLARANSDQIALSLIGLVGSVSTSTSTARSTGMAGGDGDDRLVNNNEVNTNADARATSVSVDIAGLGAAAGVDSVWNGGTKATADAFGIDGGAGENGLRNTGSVDSVAIADTDSAQIAAVAGGFALAAATSTATANSTGLLGGDAIDRIRNEGAVTATATGDAGAVSVSFASLGASIADSFADNATTANATAIGIDGGSSDDRIVSTETASIGATATANLKAGNWGLGFVGGFSRADVIAHAEANATGVEGGDGDDRIVLDGTVNSSATMSGLARAVTTQGTGAGVANVSNTGNATARGVAGGVGVDLIDSDAAITATATATNEGHSITVQGVGANFGDANTGATSQAIGIDGGAGDDKILSRDAVTATSTANVTARSFGLPAFAYGATRADATANAYATGIYGDDGFDRIFNSSAVAVDATATATSRSRTLNIFGVGVSNAGSHANSIATGINGGIGASLIVNTGSVSASAASTNNNCIPSVLDLFDCSSSFTLGGATAFGDLSSALAHARGIVTGDVNDRIENEGSVSADATLTINAAGNSSAVFGSTGSDATITGTLLATGISAGAGADRILSSGAIDLTSLSTINSDAGSWSFGGVSGVTAGITATADLIGIAGGAGEDRIRSSGPLSVTAAGAGTLSGASWTFAGTTTDNATLTNAIAATAIDGQADNDRIIAEGDTSVSIANAMTIDGGARTLFGSATGGGTVTLTSDGFGLRGDGGDDFVGNAGALSVAAAANLTTMGLASTFVGGSTNTLTIGADVSALGIDGGVGDDRLINEGTVDVDAIATLTASGGTSSRVGSAETTANTSAAASATGIAAGDDDDTVVNDGNVEAYAGVVMTGTTTAEAGGIFNDGTTRVTTDALLSAFGAVLGDGDDRIHNSANLLTAMSVSNTAAGTSTGIGLGGLSNTARSVISATTSWANGVVVGAGAGDDRIVNDGGLTATFGGTTHGSASADGSGLVEGNGISTAESFSSDIRLVGVRAGAGDDRITSSGSIAVNAAPEATSSALSDADGIAFFDAARTEATAEATAEYVSAVGIEAGDGDDFISTSGTLSVAATPAAGMAQATADWRARNDSSGNPITLAVQAFATAGASADAASAEGITAGAGSNTIVNDGLIDVDAAPVARAEAVARGAGWDGDATAVATAIASGAYAAGITAGDGGNTVRNAGTISVAASSRAEAAVVADPGFAETSEAITITVVELIPQRFGLLRRIVGYITQTVTRVIEDTIIDEGERVEETSADAGDAFAIGIRTGAGNDLIVNEGVIETSVTMVEQETQLRTGFFRNMNVTMAGIGIDAGAGDDTVVFGHQSSIVGDVYLGDGDDWLELNGDSSVLGETRGGDGTDTLHFVSNGSFLDPLIGFERAQKSGPGTFFVTALPSLESLSIDRGTLHIANDYTLAPTGEYATMIYGNGEAGLLQSSGTIALDGSLIVGRDDGLFQNEDRFRIVEAPDVAGTFASVQLPDATPVLSFTLEQSADALDVVAAVESFAVASASGDLVSHGMADFLDSALADATGGFADVLGQFQAIDDTSRLGQSLKAIAPEQYNSVTRLANRVFRAGRTTLSERLASIRARDRNGAGFDSTAAANAISSPLFETGNGDGLGAWLLYANTSGDQDATGDGYEGFGFEMRSMEAGIDLGIGDRWTIGGSIANFDVSATIADSTGVAEIDGSRVSMFASFTAPGGAYVQAGVGYGRGNYAASRRIDAAVLQDSAAGDYEGTHRIVFAEAGRPVSTGAMRSEVFAGLEHARLTESAFDETGSSLVGFGIGERSSSSLSGELGWRARWQFDTAAGMVMPRFNLSLVRDLQIDAPRLAGTLGASTGSVLSLQGANYETSGVRAGLGVDFARGETTTWSLRWNGEQRADYSDSSVLLQFNTRF